MNRFRILAVEDDATDGYFIQRALLRTGDVDLFLVRDGEQAQALLEGRNPATGAVKVPRPDLVLLDLRLPRLSGLDLLRWIRGHPELSTIPVVVLSSSRDESAVNRAYELGVRAYVVKPLDMRDLVHTLYGVLPISVPVGPPD